MTGSPNDPRDGDGPLSATNTSGLSDRLRYYAPVAGAVILIGLGMTAYYRWVWGDLGGFLDAIDKNPRLFEDLLIYFHPMGRDIFLIQAPIYGYFYSAFFAILLAPLGVLSYDLAHWVWGFLQVVAFAGVCILPLRNLIPISRRGMVLYFALCFSSLPALHNFSWGQVGMFLTLGTLASIDASARSRPWLAGALLGLVSSIKYYSGLFIFYFLIRRETRACFAFVLFGTVFFVVIPSLLIGPGDWYRFHRTVAEKLAAVDWIAPDPNSQNFVHVVLRWFGSPSVAADASNSTSLVLRLGGYATVALLLIAARLLTKKHHPAAPALTAALLFLSLPFLLKTSWPHYFVYLPFCQAAVVYGLLLPSQLPAFLRRGLLLLPLSSIALSSVFVFNLFDDHTLYQSWGCLFLADALLVLPVLALSAITPDQVNIPNGAMGVK